MAYIGAVDIGGSHIAVAIGDSTGVVASDLQRPVLSGLDTAIPKQIVTMFEKLCNSLAIPVSAIVATGVSAAGYLETAGDRISMIGSNICGGIAPERNQIPNNWKSVPLSYICNELDGVVVANDCIAALSAECLFGTARFEQNVIYCSWSTGIGFGLLVDGNILRGSRGNAGNAGHQLLAENSDKQCGCGNFGDLESLASGSALRRDSKMEPKDLFALFYAGDSTAVRVVTEAAAYVARGFFNLVAILDVQHIIVGGSIFMNHTEVLSTLLYKNLASFCPQISQEIVIVPSSVFDEKGLAKAFAMVLPEHWKDHWRTTQPWRVW